jgi:hypothetical protein
VEQLPQEKQNELGMRHVPSCSVLLPTIFLSTPTVTNSNGTDAVTAVGQVVPACASAHSDQQRLLLSVNHYGTILHVNSGEPPASSVHSTQLAA